MAAQTDLDRLNDILEQMGITMEMEEKDHLVGYKAYITKNGKKSLIGNIILKVGSYSISDHKGNTWSATKHKITKKKAICVRWLEVEPSHTSKGYGKLLMAYGVLSMLERYPSYKYSVLDDDSNASTSRNKNLYSKFGYVFTHPVKRVGENTYELSDPDKQVEISDFLATLPEIFESFRPRGRAESKAESRAESASKTNSKGANKRVTRSNSKSNKGNKEKGKRSSSKGANKKP